MFDRTLYWKNRKDNSRGQVEVTSVKVIPKGEGVLNSLGGHRSFDTKGKLHILNRVQARQKVRYHGYTQKTSNSHKSDHKYKPEKDPISEAFEHPAPTWAPDLTNNQRMKLKDIRRMELKNAK